MDEALKAAKIIALVSLSVAALCLASAAASATKTMEEATRTAQQASVAIASVTVQAENTMQDASDAIKTANTSLEGLGSLERATASAIKPLGEDAKQLDADLQEGHRLILEAGLTAMEARKASAEEREALPKITGDVEATLASTNEAIQQLGATAKQANALISDPKIQGILTDSASMTDSGARILKDGADEADKFTHPPKKKLTFWGATDATLIYIHSHIIPPLL